MSGLQYHAVRQSCSDIITDVMKAKSNPLDGYAELRVLTQIKERKERKTLAHPGPKTKAALVSLLKYMPLRTDSTVPDYVDFLAANYPEVLYEYCVIPSDQEKFHPLKIQTPQIDNRQQNSFSVITDRLNLLLKDPKFTEGLLAYYVLQSEIKKSESKRTTPLAPLSKPVTFFGIELTALPQRMATRYVAKSRQDQGRLTNKFPRINQLLKFVVSQVFGYGKFYQLTFGTTNPTLASEIQTAVLLGASAASVARAASSASPSPSLPAATSPSTASVAQTLPTPSAAAGPSPARSTSPVRAASPLPPTTPAAGVSSPTRTASPLPAGSTSPVRAASPLPPTTPGAGVSSPTRTASPLPAGSTSPVAASPLPPTTPGAGVSSPTRTASPSPAGTTSPVREASPLPPTTPAAEVPSPAVLKRRASIGSPGDFSFPGVETLVRSSSVDFAGLNIGQEDTAGLMASPPRTLPASSSAWPGSPARRDYSPAKLRPAAETYSPAAGKGIKPPTIQTLQFTVDGDASPSCYSPG